MAFTEKLFKTLDTSIWTISKGADTLTFADGRLYHVTDNTAQLAAVANIDKPLTAIHVRGAYAITDLENLLYPHDNPCLPKGYITLNLHPKVTDDPEDLHYGDPAYYQHINVPFSASYAQHLVYSMPDTIGEYARFSVKIPVDAKVYNVDKITCNMFLKAPMNVYSFAVMGEYSE